MSDAAEIERSGETDAIVPGAAASADQATLNRAVDIAMTHFARDGYAAAKLEAIAREAGMSKRMLHYHLGDKKELYRRALTRAAWSFAPPQDFLERSYAVPVEGIRRLVDVLFHRIAQNPDSVLIILRENLDPVLSAGDVVTIRNDTEVLLQIERLLLMGQDVGAFRPGISATDVVVLIASLTFFRVGNYATLNTFGELNILNQANTEGMRRLTIDAVLTFLTSNIPSSGYASYLTADYEAQPEAVDTQASDDYLRGVSVGEPLADGLYDANEPHADEPSDADEPSGE